jgi:hypothetical protein
VLNDFLVNYAEFVLRWAERSIATVSAWTDLTVEGKAEPALQTFARLPPVSRPG